MTDNIKYVFAVIGFVLSITAALPYLLDIFRQKTKPHLFSWLIWVLITAIAFAGQLTDEGGVGAWVTGFNSVVCLFIFLLGFKYGEKHITRGDWISLAASIFVILLWLVTDTPFYSMICLCFIDVSGYFPTIRKSWHKPNEETALTYFLSGMMYVTGIIALQNYTWTTLLYPASLVFTNIAFVLYLLWRRAVTKGNHHVD